MQLRSQGWPLRRIASEVGVALSTVSLWVRGIAPSSPHVAAALAAVAGATEADAMDLRRCGCCKRELPVSSFNRHESGRQWRCRDCYRAYFQARGDLHRAQTRAARARRRREARTFIDEYLRLHNCADCGEEDSLVLEFDHVGEKRAHVSVLMHEGASERRLMRELTNCDVVCVNCHRVRTAERRGSWRLDPGRLDDDQRLGPGTRRNMAYVHGALSRSACIDCGDGRLTVLEFDHVGTKSGNVIEMARRGSSLLRLQEEITECEIRCANCHRRRTRICLQPASKHDYE